MQSGCEGSEFKHPHLGHIITRDLGLIRDEGLRAVCAKGAKFREVPYLDTSKIKQQIRGDIDNISKKWTTKNKIGNAKLKNWREAMHGLCSDRIDHLSRTRKYEGPILSNRKSKAELDRLRESYVITVVDKAANNFAFTCKKFYFLRLAEELGLNNITPGNETYAYINETEGAICDRICGDLARFKVEPKEEERKLAVLYQTPKFHKDPPKMRYIAGNVATVLSGLDDRIAKILKMCKAHFRNLCRKSEEFSGIRCYFDVETSAEVKQMFDGLHGRAKTVTINDFSTLYTLFDHNHLLTNISWLLQRLGKNKGMDYISVGYNKAWWSRADEGKFETYGLVEIAEMIGYLIGNTHIKSMGSIFKQTKGMIMGGKSSGWLSDCSLMVDEFRYVDALVKGGQVELARRLRHFCRYRDDCSVCNYSGFSNVTGDIYPPSLSLTQENDSDQAADVLDMSVVIDEGNSFITKVYCKTDTFPFDVISLPFLDSNINVKLCYLVFYGQILRYQRLCSYRVDFEDRCRKLAGELIGRSYNKDSLGVQFCKVVGKYSAEFQKWQIPINISTWFNRILNPDPDPDPDVNINPDPDPDADTNRPDSQIGQRGLNARRSILGDVPVNCPPVPVAPTTIDQQPGRIITSLSQPVTNGRRLNITDQTRQHSTQPTHNRTLRPRRDVNYKV
jgi:hypothetical protein